MTTNRLWDCCSACQEEDFDGWPDDDELENIPGYVSIPKISEAEIAKAAKANEGIGVTKQNSDKPKKAVENLSSVQKKWLEEANRLGSDRIVTNLSEAKQIIHSFMVEMQTPMNITAIFNGLKGVVPGAVLKKSLNSLNEASKNDPMAIKCKIGRNASNTLYYCYESSARPISAQQETIEAIQKLKEVRCCCCCCC